MRTAFDAALKRELQDVMRKAKQMANQIKEPADVWELEHYLTERRKELDRKYDYRYSQLTQVFGDSCRKSDSGMSALVASIEWWATYSGRWSFLSSRVYRGSSRKFFSFRSVLNHIKPWSCCMYARLSHSKARSTSPR